MGRAVLRRIGLTIAAIAALLLTCSSDARAQPAPSERTGARAEGPVSSDRPADRRPESAHLRARALDLGFNLDHAEALATFKAAIAADPLDPAAHRLTAAVLWIHALFQQGAVTADDYLGQVRSQVQRKPPPAEMAAAFRSHLDRALALADERLRVNPRDADAHFQVGAAHGFLASYTATIEGRVMGGFGAARRAYREHNRALELDPNRKDAGLIVGMYRYAVSLLPWHWRLLADLAGFDGDRDRGLRLIEDAAAYPSDVQTNALFTLVVIYNREKRYDAALDVIAELQRRYPRNRLLWLEAGTTALRAGRFGAGRDALEQGLAKLAGDRRPRAFGEEARWHYAYGTALVGLRQIDAAERELRTALAAEAQEWIHGRARTELGKLADLRGDRVRAVEEYQEARRICRAHDDSACSEEAARLLKHGARER
jgi:tetratricopeptide (TPR) repeat protein